MNIHFVSSGTKFPYSYYLGVMSALANQSLPIKLWHVEESDSKYWKIIKNYAETSSKIEICKIDKATIPKYFYTLPTESEKYTAIFDYTIWNILYREGGVLMELDSFTFKDWSQYLEDDKEMLIPRATSFINVDFHMCGIIARKGSPLVKEITEIIDFNIFNEAVKWGDFGMTPYLYVVCQNLDKISVLDMNKSTVRKVDGNLDNILGLSTFENENEILYTPYYSTSQNNADERFLTEKNIEVSKDFISKYSRATINPEILYPSVIEQEKDLPMIVDKYLPNSYAPQKMRFHIMGLPHTKTNKSYNACAYTMKVYNFCKMMMSLGHEVYHYGSEGSSPDCTEQIDLLSQEEFDNFFGKEDTETRKLFQLQWSNDVDYWKLFIDRFEAEAMKRVKRKDIICITAGRLYHEVSDRITAATGAAIIETGIGYSGTFANYKVYESYSHMHQLYGYQNYGPDGDNYDTVIPNYFDPNDFEYQEEKQDYHFFIGRLINRKGLQTVAQVLNAKGEKLKIAGQGFVKQENGIIYTDDGEQLVGDNIEYMGVVDVPTRNELMKNAKAVWVPTTYVEPFGGVNVEAQMCGTPVITTDWGAFTETVLEGVTGYRCRTFNEFSQAVDNINLGRIKSIDCRRWAERNYSLERVRWMYQAYFEQVLDLYDKGWYTVRDPETETVGNYDRYRKFYPNETGHERYKYYRNINITESIPAAHFAKIVMETQKFDSITDLGCGTGLYLKPFYAAGKSVFGVDIDPVGLRDDLRQIPEKYLKCEDLTDYVHPTDADEQSDILICFEVLEHIDEEYEDIVINKIKNSGKLIYISVAQPTQVEEGHINLKPKQYWSDKLEAAGLVRDYDLERDTIDRIKKNYHMGWLRNNLMIFHNTK